MENWQITVSIAGIFIGILSGLNAILLAGLRSQMDKYSKENREDHNKIFDSLNLKQSITGCDEKTKACNGNRDKKFDVAKKTDDIITKERRIVMDEKIDNLAESVQGIGVSLDNLSICISKYTKGECP